jgi:hypothetical protein
MTRDTDHNMWVSFRQEYYGRKGVDLPGLKLYGCLISSDTLPERWISDQLSELRTSIRSLLAD